MKKVFDYKKVVAIFAASTLFACTQDFTNEFAQVENKQEESTAMKALPKRRTYEEALTIAQDAIGMLGESSATRSGKPRTVNIDDVQYVVNSSSTRSTDAPDTLMYVFNYEDNAGFAVVSANRATEELIAVTEQGNYTVGEETENGGFNMYMDMATAYLSNIGDKVGFDTITGGFDQLVEYKGETICDTISYGPYLTVRWGQEWPYNNYCYTTSGKKAYAGCVAIAIAQIMTYYKHPQRLIIKYDASNSVTSLNWYDILQHRDGVFPICDCVESSISHNQIAKLVRQIGFYVSMDYGEVGTEEGSGASSENVYYALHNLGYKSSTYQQYSFEKVLSSLGGEKLVYMRGGSPNEEGGHAWVVDGCTQITRTRTEAVRPVGSLIWQIIQQDVFVDKYNHINWGWDGNNNGYFLSTVFDSSRPYMLDPNSSTNTNHHFSMDLKIYPNIEIDN